MALGWVIVWVFILVSEQLDTPPNASTVYFDLGPSANRTVRYGSWVATAADGVLRWPAIQRNAHFSVLQLMTEAEADQLRALLPQSFDEDKDSVDLETTFEFYLEKHGSFDTIGGIPGKPDAEQAVLRAREPARAALAALLRPIVRERVAPFVNDYVVACKHRCHVCFSLVRRYVDGERRSHAAHFDIQALATVVVSLNSAGQDFDGGLFVSTSSVDERFLALQKGEGVVHTSDLLHGVRVTRGARWSWILWFKDDEGCRADPKQWHKAEAEAGDAVAQFIHAHRVGMFGGTASEKFGWLRQSAEGNFTRAMNELGMAYKEGTGTLPDAAEAQRWFRKAAADEPDAMYNLAMLAIQSGEVVHGVSLLKQAAKLGSTLAMTNLGVAYYKGVGGLEKSLRKAVAWFGRAGTADAMYKAAQVSLELAPQEADAARMWLTRASIAGHEKATAELQRQRGITPETQDL